jgi:hypothetical protein
MKLLREWSAEDAPRIDGAEHYLQHDTGKSNPPTIRFHSIASDPSFITLAQ